MAPSWLYAGNPAADSTAIWDRAVSNLGRWQMAATGLGRLFRVQASHFDSGGLVQLWPQRTNAQACYEFHFQE
jgi:hypothetical protein